jgi:hypothetical protein
MMRASGKRLKVSMPKDGNIGPAGSIEAGTGHGCSQLARVSSGATLTLVSHVSLRTPMAPEPPVQAIGQIPLMLIFGAARRSLF